MKHLKMFALAAIAAMGVTALVGGGVAHADLFTDSAHTIKYHTGTVIDLSLNSGTSTSLKDTSGNTIGTCSASTVKGKTTTETGEAISIGIETLWGGCNPTTVAGGSLEVKWTSGSSGEVIGKKSEWTSSVGGASCTYGFGEGTKLGTITGGSQPVLAINTPINKTAGGILCPATTVMVANYIFTEPHAIYVGGESKGGASTSLYTDSAKTVKYPLETVIDLSLSSGTSTKLTNGSETIATCTGSTWKGKTTATGETVSTSVETLTWSGCSQTTDTVTNGKIEVKWTSGSNGEVIGKESQWTLGIFGTSCSYGFGEGIKLGTLVGGETPTLKIEASIPRTGGGVLCPSAATWDAEYVVIEPHALFVGA